jgi:hypothetical protein
VWWTALTNWEEVVCLKLKETVSITFQLHSGLGNRMILQPLGLSEAFFE